MIIFDWEKAIVAVTRDWPTSGPTYQFFHFWTDYSQSRWLLLLFLIVLAYKIGWRKLVVPSIFTIFAVVFGDLVSRRIVKAFIMRPRPNFVDTVCDVSRCWGFVSSHSTNITAAAVFLCLYDKRNAYWAVPSVCFVCFSRIYLIDHFALDVLGGMAIGTVIGILIYVFFKSLTGEKFTNLINSRIYR